CATVFVEIFRNVPALILLIFFAFGLPNLLPADSRRTLLFANPVVDAVSSVTSLPVPYYAFAAILALSLNTGAHLAEILRSGMDAVPAERIEAARTFGASSRTACRTITVPDGVRIAFPGISNRLVHNLKNTALVSFLAVPDAYHQIQAVITETFEATELLLFAAGLYLALAALLELGLRRIKSALWRGRPIDRSADV
ncbi:MAG: ABC transporter permease subunit, partial [Actinomycetota bacterium]|nr:ABC transporter permease subunit [Actinomycetota bacterium]